MRALLFVGLLLMAACGKAGPEAYPPGYRQNFMQACERQGAPEAFCGCVWDQIEAHVAPRDFAALERLSPMQRDASPLQAQIAGYSAACKTAP